MDEQSKMEAHLTELKENRTTSGVSDKELQAQIKTLTDKNHMQMGVNKNLASKVLGLEKDLQSEKKRRLEAEKKLLDAQANATETRAFMGQSLSEHEDL